MASDSVVAYAEALPEGPFESQRVLVDPYVGENADHRPFGDGCKLGLDQCSDLRLRLRDREVERERRYLVGCTLLADELVPDLRVVQLVRARHPGRAVVVGRQLRVGHEMEREEPHGDPPVRLLDRRSPYYP